VNFAAPRAGFIATIFDKRLESFQIAFDAGINKSERAANRFKKTFRFVFKPQSDARLIAAFRLKADRSGVVRAGCRAPRDALIGRLLGNLRVPFSLLQAMFARQCVFLSPS
jgi:hypothetical protein